MSYDADVLMYNTLGPPFTHKTTIEEGIGGSELETVQIAHALTERGHKVVVATNIHEKVLEQGVWYVPAKNLPRLRVRSLYIQRCSPQPEVFADRIVVRATDTPQRDYDIHNQLLSSGRGALVCVTNWQASLFPFVQEKIVINPMLGATPPTEKIERLFLYASAALKGADYTFSAWRYLKDLFPDDLADTRLGITVPGYSGRPPELTTKDKMHYGMHYLTTHNVVGYRRHIASAEGIFYASGFQETFCCVAALAERSHTRTHILCMRGVAGIAEAVKNRSLITTDLNTFVKSFMAAYLEPTSEAWYSNEVEDRSPAAYAPFWELALEI